MTDKEIEKIAAKKIPLTPNPYGMDYMIGEHNLKNGLRREGFILGYKTNLTIIEEYKTALEDLIEAIPGQTNDKDWWPDSLTDAVNEANKLLENK